MHLQSTVTLATTAIAICLCKHPCTKTTLAMPYYGSTMGLQTTTH